jgi:hypothetical protein
MMHRRRVLREGTNDCVGTRLSCIQLQADTVASLQLANTVKSDNTTTTTGLD